MCKVANQCVRSPRLLLPKQADKGDILAAIIRRISNKCVLTVRVSGENFVTCTKVFTKLFHVLPSQLTQKLIEITLLDLFYVQGFPRRRGGWLIRETGGGADHKPAER